MKMGQFNNLGRYCRYSITLEQTIYQILVLPRTTVENVNFIGIPNQKSNYPL